MTTNGKTATILMAATGLVAAAMLLGNREGGAAGRAGREPVEPEGQPLEIAGQCGGDAPAKASGDFGYGTMAAAFSSQRVLAGGDGELYMAVALDARDIAVANRPALNLAIVIDRSGSMEGEKFARAKQAAAGLVARLGSTDRVALVQYDDAAQVVVPMTLMDATGKGRLREAIGSLQTAGGTNLHDGMALGRDEVLREIAGGSVGHVNRVILMSDGQANVGVVDTGALARVAGAAAEKGVRLTTVGVGLDYNEDLMEAIAENGRGQYYYVKDAGSLDAVFAGELKSMQATVATRAELRLEPNCAGVEISEVFGYASRQEGTTTVIPLADVFGGDKRKIVVRLKVPAGLGLGAAKLVGATLAFDDAKSGARKSTRLALGVNVTKDAAAVEKSVDKTVMAQVLEVESARALRTASTAYEKGDSDGARAELKRAKADVAAKAARYAIPAAEAAPLMQSYDEMDRDVGSYAAGSAEGKGLLKATKMKSRQMNKASK